MIRIGILGCGRIAQLIHIKQFARVPNVEIVAIADSNADNLSAAAAIVPTAQRFSDWTELVNAAITDAVVVTLPPAMHAEAALAAFAADNHVYLEKPLALSLADGERIVRARADTGRIGQIGLNFRHHPNYLDLRARIAAGQLGEIIAVRTAFCSARRTLPGWKASRQTGGSVLRELGVHHLDLVEFILGEPIERISAVERSIDYEADCATVIAHSRSGIAADLVLSLSSGVSMNRIEILGTAGHLVSETSDARPRRIDGLVTGSARVAKLRRALERAAPSELLMSPGYDPSFAAAFEAFADAINASKPATPDFDVGLRALKLVLTAEEAAARGAFVDLQMS